jgi:hypothetical protein
MPPAAAAWKSLKERILNHCGNAPMRSSEESESLPLVSIIMPAYNAEQHLAGAIESVLAQSYTHWELLIVNDGSQDKTASIASHYANTHPDRVAILHHTGQANRGVAASRNLAIHQAHGLYVAFLDADDLWRPSKLSQQTAFMAAHPEMALSYTRSGILRESPDDLFLPGLREYGSPVPPDPREAFLAIALGHAHFAFSSVMAKRDAILAVGCFDQNLRFQNEDRLLVAKMAALYRLGQHPNVVCDYRVHAASYSIMTARQKMTPLLFLDLQVRLLRWLRGERHQHELVRRLATGVLPRQAIPALLAACANPALRGSALDLMWKYFLASPAGGARAVLRVLLSMAGRPRSGDRERSQQELQAACQRVARALQKAGIRRIVLYGAGQHTERLLQSHHLASCEIAGILDDRASCSEVMGIPVFRPDEFRSRRPCATIISSDTLQSQLFKKAKQHGLKSVYRLYP